MILNDSLNKIIKLMLEVDEEFKQEYATFVSKLPNELIQQCQTNKTFTGSLEDNYSFYDFYYDLFDDNAELEAQLANGEEYSLSIYNIYINELLRAPIETEDDIKNQKHLWEFAAFTYTNCDGYQVDFSFKIHRVSKEKYFIIMSKYVVDLSSNAPEIEERRAVKSITFNDFIIKLKMSPTKR